MAACRRRKREDDKYRLLDFLWEPIPKVDGLGIPISGLHRPVEQQQQGQEGGEDDEARHCPLALDSLLGQRSHIRRWHDFNYPVMRVVLQDLLWLRAESLLSPPAPSSPTGSSISFRSPYSSSSPSSTRAPSTAPSMSSWSSGGNLQKMPPKIPLAVITPPSTITPCTDVPLQYAGRIWQRLKDALSHGARQLSRTIGDVELELCLHPLRRDNMTGDDWTLQVLAPESRDEDPRTVVLGFNKSAETFPLDGLSQLSRISTAENQIQQQRPRIERILREIGTACWQKQTPYAFALTSEGAALLLFSQAYRAGHDKPHLGVRYVVVPWETREDRVLEFPLVMGLWALCVVALSDVVGKVAAPLSSLSELKLATTTTRGEERLNSWKEVVVERGRRVFEHGLIRQVSWGHPPGARILSRVELDDGSGELQLQHLADSQRFRFGVMFPNGQERVIPAPLSLGACSISTSLIPTPLTAEVSMRFGSFGDDFEISEDHGALDPITESVLDDDRGSLSSSLISPKTCRGKENEDPRGEEKGEAEVELDVKMEVVHKEEEEGEMEREEEDEDNDERWEEHDNQEVENVEDVEAHSDADQQNDDTKARLMNIAAQALEVMQHLPVPATSSRSNMPQSMNKRKRGEDNNDGEYEEKIAEADAESLEPWAKRLRPRRARRDYRE